ncbi:MAG TPA: GDSL-type esterase/lipase family protein [Blastocatellia bacterium]|nr:GDSL-type esterase/lipase family protein [Blastocatellia bacterium]
MSATACLAFILLQQQIVEGSQTPAGDRAPRPIEDPSGQAMHGFYEALHRAYQGEWVTRIVHYGDSHVAADILTGALRREFQLFFGDAGAGFVLPSCPWYSRTGVSSRASAGWQIDGATQASLADGRFGLAGVSLNATASGEWMTLTTTASYFDIYFLKQPGGGAVDILLDGVEQKRNVSLASRTFEPGYLEVVAEGGRAHTIEICTTSAGRTQIFGIAIERNSAGVVYDALGINGARASRPLRWNWKLLASNLERRDPDLIIVAYGSNEVSDADLDLEEYQKHFTTLLERFRRAAPRASVLVISPPDRAVLASRRWKTVARMSALVEAQRRAAFKSSAAFYDLFSAMGGAGAIGRWATQARPLAQADRVHLTSAGYRIVAGWIYSALMEGYLRAISS